LGLEVLVFTGVVVVGDTGLEGSFLRGRLELPLWCAVWETSC
jgi:hypothetical protein